MSAVNFFFTSNHTEQFGLDTGRDVNLQRIHGFGSRFRTCVAFKTGNLGHNHFSHVLVTNIFSG